MDSKFLQFCTFGIIKILIQEFFNSLLFHFNLSRDFWMLCTYALSRKFDSLNSLSLFT